MKLRVGVIGQGPQWQTRYSPALRVLTDRYDVRAVFGIVAKLAENIAAEFQADVVDGYQELVQRNDIDAVLILERTWLGWLPMLAACEAGKAVYWAGDLCVDCQSDNDLRSRIDESGISLMAEFPRRFAPATLRLKELIATQLGQPELIFAHRRLTAESGARSMHREMMELVDWCRYVVGRSPDRVLSLCHPPFDSQNPDSVDASLYRRITLFFDATENDSPVTAQISCGRYIPEKWNEAFGHQSPSDMQVRCERGIAFVDLPTNAVWFDDGGRNVERLESETPVGQQLLSNFHRAATSLLRNLSGLDDVFAAAMILEAANLSESVGGWAKVST
ncbi:MAG: Gfo/Idh/MocA family oxidoreductase [Planctomycetota bacterium]